MPDKCEDSGEELVIEKLDAHGVRWVKVYVGGGLHFVGWLEQFKEVYGDENVVVEEVAAEGLACYGEGKERLFRIWVREEK